MGRLPAAREATKATAAKTNNALPGSIMSFMAYTSILLMWAGLRARVSQASKESADK